MKKPRKPRSPSDILNDIHEGYSVTLEEALSCITWMEERLEAMDTKRRTMSLQILGVLTANA